MSEDTTLDQRVQQMLAAGKLEPAHAQRLQAAFRDQTAPASALQAPEDPFGRHSG